MSQKRKMLSKAVRQKVYLMFDGHCAYCGQPIAYEDMQVDHFKPLANGGADSIENYYPACRMCNWYKTTYSIKTLRRQLAGIPKRLEKDVRFRLAVAYGMVEVTGKPVKFYFETHKEHER